MPAGGLLGTYSYGSEIITMPAGMGLYTYFFQQSIRTARFML
jgi:hypothetical protein